MSQKIKMNAQSAVIKEVTAAEAEKQEHLLISRIYVYGYAVSK